MTLESLALLALAIGASAGLPVWMVMCIRQLHSRERSKGTVALGNALQELDRLVARPSAEYKVEAEDPNKEIEDAKGGE